MSFSLYKNGNFSPLNVSSCLLWLDASDMDTLYSDSAGTTLATVGGTVGYWKDKSGSNNNYTQATAGNRPTYTSASNINFGTTSASVQFLTNTYTVATGGWDIFSVSLPNTSANGAWRTLLRGFNTDHPILIQSGGTQLGYYANGTTNFNQFGSLTFDGTATALLYVTISPTRSYAAALNGTITLSSAANTGNADTQMFYSLGNLQGGGQPWGTLNEIIIMPNTTLTQRQQIEGYLAWKWGLQGSLPAAHPYKNNPPFQNNLPLPTPITTTITFQSSIPPPNFISPSLTGFTPLSITNCTLWLDGSDPLNTGIRPAGGTKITSWADKSSNAWNATVSILNAPTYSNVGNYSYLYFSGDAVYLRSSATVPRNTHTLIAVWNPFTVTANLSGNTRVFAYQQSGANYVVFPYQQNLTPRGYVTSYDTTAIDGANSTLVENSVANQLAINTAVISSGSQKVYRNGTQQSQNTQVINSGTSETLDIGRYAPTNTEFYYGYIAEMISYSRALTDAERQQVEAYLASKWGLSYALPASQPFKPPIQMASAGFFNPNTIPTTVFWFDASDPNGNGTLLANNANVSTWADKSGNGTNATTNTNYPIFTTNSLNKLPTLRFNGASLTANYLDIPAFDFSTTNRTIFFVIQNTAAAVGSGNAGIPHFFFPGSGFTNALSIVNWVGAAVQGQQTIASFTGPLNSYIILMFRFGASAGFGELWRNGVQQSTGTKTAGGSSFQNATTGYRIGWLTTGDTSNLWYFDGNIAEMIGWKTTITDTQRQQVEGYLAWKWGLQSSLPASHPFAVVPPLPF